MDPRDRERLLILETAMSRQEARLVRVEEDVREIPVIRDRLDRFEQAANTVANNVIEMQHLQQQRADAQNRTMTIIERQARASESIEAQLYTALQVINTNTQGAQQLAGKAAEHAGKAVETASKAAEHADKAAQNTSKFALYDPKNAAPRGEHSEQKSNKHWVPRAIANLQKWSWKPWLGLTLVLFFACIALAIFYAIEKTRKMPSSTGAPQIESHK